MIDLSNIKDKIVVLTTFPSMGDYLFISNLPELWYKKYGLYTYFSESCRYHNDETYELLFESNPYVKGKTNEEHNVLFDPKSFDEDPSGIKKNEWFSKYYQEHFGFFDENIIPKIYYEPKKIESLKNSGLIDVTSRNYRDSAVFKSLRIPNIIKDIVDKNIELKKYHVIYNNPDTTINRHHYNQVGGSQELKINTVFDYCDILSSIDYCICFNSGSGLLASSIKEYYNKNLIIYFITPGQNMDSGNFNPPNCEIIIL